MPTYSYACTACGHRFDAQQSFSDDPLTECPECAGRLRKLFNSVGIVFKGSGFYRTDSRGTGKNGSGKNGSGNNGSGKNGAGQDGSGRDGSGKNGSTESGSSVKSDTAGAGSSGSGGTATGGTRSDTGSTSKAPAKAGSAA